MKTKQLQSTKAVRLAESVGAMLKPEDVAGMLNIGQRTLWRWLAQGLIPQPDLRMERTIRWRPATIDKWLSSQAPLQRQGGEA